MEKYASDVENVYETFPEQEAVESNESRITDYAADISEPSQHGFQRFSSNNQLHSEELFVDGNLKKVSFQGSNSTCDIKPVSVNQDYSVLKEMPALESAIVSETSYSQNCSTQNQNSWNYEIYYKPFQSSGSVTQSNMLPDSQNSDERINSGAFNISRFQVTPVQKDGVGNTVRSYSPDDEVLCIAVQSSDKVSNHSSTGKEEMLSISVPSTSDTDSHKHAADQIPSCSDIPTTLFTGNEQCSNDKCSHEKTFLCDNLTCLPPVSVASSFVKDDVISDSEVVTTSAESSLCTDNAPAGCHKENAGVEMNIEALKKIELSSVSAVTSTVGDFRNKTDMSESENHAQSQFSQKFGWEKDSSVDVTVGLSQLPEQNLSLEQHNAYLDDFVMTGVPEKNGILGSQEDMNGNNLPVDIFCQENNMLESYQSKPQVKTSEGDKTHTEDQNDAHNSSGNKQDDLKALAKTVCKLQENDCSDGNLSSKDSKAASLNGAIPKKDISKHSCIGLACSCDTTCHEMESAIVSCHEMESAIVSGNVCSEITEASDSSKAFNEVCTVNESCASSGIVSSTESKIEENGNILSKEGQLVPETRLVFSPVDGIFRSVPVDQPLGKPENDSKTAVQNDFSAYAHDIENNAFLPSENQQNYSRLQRPTTLDLPCCSITPSQALPSQQNFMPPSVASTVEEPPTGTLVDLEDSSPSGSHMSMAAKNFCQASAVDKNTSETQMSQLGNVKPFWIPDSKAANCMHCSMKFTVIKRRHHCRACGKVLCSRCCNQKARLPYLQNKEDRVCQQCFEVLSSVHSDSAATHSGESPVSSSCGSSPSFSPALANANTSFKGYWKPHPNNPDDYCSTVSPLQQMQHLANRPPPTVMVPVGVLKRGNKPRGEPKQVIFSDGIRPGGDLTDLTEQIEVAPPYQRQGRRRVDKLSMGNENSPVVSVSNCSTAKKKTSHTKSRHKRVVVIDSEGPLPTVLLPHDDPTADEKMDLSVLLSRLKDELSSPVVFAVTKNLHILTKIIKLDCCFGKECWCFASQGLCTVGQDEVIFILERYPEEEVIPRDVFRFFNKVYDNATKGSTVGDLGYLIFSDGIFGSWEHRGFLFVRPTFQCLRKLVLPGTPFLCAVLIQKWEVPWAKVFPLRLMLRLGAECRYYPCSLVSVRTRKPVYFEIGQTIMNVLADLRNYQFTIPFVPGLVVHMEEKKTSVIIPHNRYEQLMKVLNSNNVEHVLALGSNFSPEADSHLVCMQKDEGDYHTQAINIENTPRKVTGASFIVFSGALKSSTGLSAKFNIVEDGLLVQIPQETMTALHSALHDMHDLTINCGPVNAPEPDEVVVIHWTDDDKKFNIGVASPVDGRSLEGIPSLRIHTSTDYAGENFLIRWTEVFFMETDRNGNSMRVETLDPCKVAESIAQAFCMALIPYLDALAESEMTRIGLRVILDAEQDKVEYDVGALGKPLPSMYMNALDSSLIPVISRITGASHDEPIALELIFYILMK